MSSCVARQPIFNQKLHIYGYELLYRQDNQSLQYNEDNMDGDMATSETIINSFHEMGIERVTGGKRAFINFTENLLLDGVATILSNRILVVEMLESIQPTPEVMDACRKLRARGYKIALDDYILEEKYFPLLEIADIVKIDFISTPLEQIQKHVSFLKKHKVTLLAEKLENNDMFEQALKLGFTLFQGYFFSRPVNMSTDKKLTPLRANCLRLIRLAMQPNVNFTKIANIIKQDVALSYRLLRVVNSAYFGLRYTVKNIRQALAILGMDEVKKWITLISLAEIRDNKPDELIRISLIRGRFLELIAEDISIQRDAEDLFMLGLLSLMDALMEMPMEHIVQLTSLSPDIAESLLGGQGKFSDLLAMIKHYEQGEWDAALSIAERHHISEDTFTKRYMDAIEWANYL